jgi:hypothetical protein
MLLLLLVRQSEILHISDSACLDATYELDQPLPTYLMSSDMP